METVAGGEGTQGHNAVTTGVKKAKITTARSLLACQW
jgi:hypothetical protein